MSSTPKILYIIGAQRSGTTLMASILGSIPGVFAAGKVRDLWSQGVLRRQLCACGEPAPECPIWKPVLGKALAGTSAASVAQWHHRHMRIRRTPSFVRQDAARLLAHPEVAAYADVVRKTYEALWQETGASVVVDSSKYPPDGALLGLLFPERVRYLHMVRDPRGVAFSWQRQKLRHDRGQEEEMDRYPAWYSALVWLAFDKGAERVVRRYGRRGSVTLRYADLVGDPKGCLDRIVDRLDLPRGSMPFRGTNQAEIAPGHVVGGNPNRFRTGLVEILEDVEWRERMRSRDRLVVTALTWRRLRRYGYR